MSRLFSKDKKEKTFPQWALLFADVILAYLSFCLSIVLFLHFNPPFVAIPRFFSYSILYCVVCWGVFYGLNIHSALVRYSNAGDLLRIPAAVLFTNVILALSVLIFKQMDWVELSFYNILTLFFINTFISISGLLLIRLLAKWALNAVPNYESSAASVNVLIFGDDKEAIMAKQALETSNRYRYNIKGFISFNHNHLNTRVQNKRVYHLKDLARLKETEDIEQLIIVHQNLSSVNKKLLLDHCLRIRLRVITIPPIERWISGEPATHQIQKLRIEDLLQRPPIDFNQTNVSEDFNDKAILITGAAGSIGSEIVRQVAPYSPKSMILSDQAETPLYKLQLELREEFPYVQFEILLTDIRNDTVINDIFKKHRPDIVFHAAAYKHVPILEFNPFEAIQTNVVGTRNLAEAAVRFHTKRFIYISTDKAVNPTNVMGASKRISEIYCQSLNEHLAQNNNKPTTQFITTRFANVMDSNGSVIPRFRKQIKKGGPVTVTHPDIVRYFMTIEEAVKLVLEAETMGHGGEIFSFDMGKPVKIVDLAQKMILLASPKQEAKIKIIFTGLRPGEKLYEELIRKQEKQLPTHHEKIYIAKDKCRDYNDICQDIELLMEICKGQDNKAIVKSIKQLVPEYSEFKLKHDIVKEMNDLEV